MTTLERQPLGIIRIMIEHLLMKGERTEKVTVTAIIFRDDIARYDNGGLCDQVRIKANVNNRERNYVFEWNIDRGEFSCYYDEDEYILSQKQREALLKCTKSFKRGYGRTPENIKALMEIFKIKEENRDKAIEILKEYEERKIGMINAVPEEELATEEFDKKWNILITEYVEKLRWLF